MQHQSLSYASRTGNLLPRAAYAPELLRKSHNREDLPTKALRRAASPARPGSSLLRISDSLRAEALHSPRGFSPWRTAIAETRDAAIGRIAIDVRVRLLWQASDHESTRRAPEPASRSASGRGRPATAP